jgi:hypothetical protein
MPNIAVIHLIRAKNGIEPFRRFLDSYLINRGGIDHDLILVFKGFTRWRIPDDYRRLSMEVRSTPFFASDFGFDIRPYFLCAKAFPHAFLCFLNSYSVLRDKEWLAKLYTYGQREDVGAAGATGSWESHLSNLKTVGTASPSVIRKFEAHYDPFPNPHLRTNALLISRKRFLMMNCGFLLTKSHVHRFESGKAGFTRQIKAMGLQPLVIGKDGMAYEWERWPESNTFRKGDQCNLLVDDNQTRVYSESDPAQKKYLAQITWGISNGHPPEGTMGT